MGDPFDRVTWRLEHLDREEQSHPGNERARWRRVRAVTAEAVLEHMSAIQTRAMHTSAPVEA